jgi:hypothetical protein
MVIIYPGCIDLRRGVKPLNVLPFPKSHAYDATPSTAVTDRVGVYVNEHIRKQVHWLLIYRTRNVNAFLAVDWYIHEAVAVVNVTLKFPRALYVCIDFAVWK